MESLFNKINLLFLVAIRRRYANGNPIIIKKFNSPLYHHKLLKAVTVRKRKTYKFSRMYTITYKVYGKFHRENGPAHINMYGNGEYEKSWYINGQLHRTDGPARIANTSLHGGFLEIWYYRDSCHRIGGPAYLSHGMEYGGYRELWYIHGVLHRDDGPAFFDHSPYFGGHNERWYNNGILHRADGPAQITGAEPRTKKWYINGVPSAIGYYRALGLTIQNAPTHVIQKQRKWINWRIHVAKKFKRNSITLKRPICEEILRELELQYELTEPYINGYDPRWALGYEKLTVRLDRDSNHKKITI